MTKKKDADYRRRVFDPWPYCAHGDGVEACWKPTRQNSTYCTGHAERLRAKGELGTVALRTVDGSVLTPSPDGYLRTSCVGHPIARANGSILEHRRILFDAIAYDDKGRRVRHGCHWCGRIVLWELTWPESAAALVVDHLDGNRANNALENLVPSCAKCNGGRRAEPMAVPEDGAVASATEIVDAERVAIAGETMAMFWADLRSRCGNES